MSAPTMTRAHRERLERLTDEQRHRVLERAAILHADGDMSWAEADARALVLEGIVQPELPGVSP